MNPAASDANAGATPAPIIAVFTGERDPRRGGAAGCVAKDGR